MRHLIAAALVAGRPAARGAEGEAAAADLEQRVAEAVAVRGHLRRQRHGPGLAQVRWVYVASYEARRWVAPRPATIVVGRRG